MLKSWMVIKNLFVGICLFRTDQTEAVLTGMEHIKEERCYEYSNSSATTI